jgi:acyl dehydratase
MIGLTVESLRVGDTAQIIRVASEQDIAQFVDAVGDHNPIHADRDYAAGTMFGQRIAPGIWTAGLISAVIGTRLPGPGAIYLSQDLKFLRPVRFGDAIAARVEVLETNRERNRIRLKTVCVNHRGEEVLTGEALVMPSPTPVVYDTGPRGAGLVAFWTLQPWAWAAQGATLVGMVTLSALAASARRWPSTPGPVPAQAIMRASWRDGS